MKKEKLPGINIQFPISQLILEGKKLVETRTYPIPNKYLNTEMWIVETPGKAKSFKARIVGKVIFTRSFEYQNKKQFYADRNRHQVTPDSPWAWTNSTKWGWELKIVEVLKIPIPLKQRTGIKFTKAIEI